MAVRMPRERMLIGSDARMRLAWAASSASAKLITLVSAGRDAPDDGYGRNEDERERHVVDPARADNDASSAHQEEPPPVTTTTWPRRSAGANTDRYISPPG